MICRLDPNTTTYYTTKRGRAHLAGGKPCQDYSLAENLGTDCQIVCLADGHGAEEFIYSDVGAKIACELFIEMVRILKAGYERAGIWDWTEYLKTMKFKTAFVQCWRKKVLEDYERREDAGSGEKLSPLRIIRRYGTTFLFALRYCDSIVLGQLGDGAILMGFPDVFREDPEPDGRWQLFKRHAEKYDTQTNSMASDTAEYAFLIDSYKREKMAYVLLSTDGIYDRLDREDAFYCYSQILLRQFPEDWDGEPENPFLLDEETDLSRFTGDDCSIALMRFWDTTASGDENVRQIESLSYTEVKFVRSLKALEIYTGVDKDGEAVELHITSQPLEVPVDFAGKIETLAPKEIKNLGNRWLYAYRTAELEGCDRLSILFERERQLEKQYCQPGEAAGDSNGDWLEVFEKLLTLRASLRETGAVVIDDLKEVLFLTKDHRVLLLTDGLRTGESTPVEDTNGLLGLDTILESIGILGVLSCGDRRLPLYRGACHQSQNIPVLHRDPQDAEAGEESAVLARCIYRPGKGYGLWNGSGTVWKLADGKEVPAGRILQLKAEHEFTVPTKLEVAPELGIWDSGAIYAVRWYRWEEWRVT